jgi:hypothetical protein
MTDVRRLGQALSDLVLNLKTAKALGLVRSPYGRDGHFSPNAVGCILGKCREIFANAGRQVSQAC